MSAGRIAHAWRPLFALVAFALVACGSSASSAELPGDRIRRLEAGDSLTNLTRPAGYAGTLPCLRACKQVETWLVLHPDGSYRLRERLLEGGASARVSVGRWTLSRDSVPMLSLLGPDSLSRQLAVSGALTLQVPGSDGESSQAPAELVRVSMPIDLSAPLTLRGEFRYLTDAATLVSCNGGLQFPVAGDSAFVRLQRNYREQHLGSGAAILVEVSGRVEQRAEAGRGTTVETVVIDSFTVVDRKLPCASTQTVALVAIGDWNLRALDGVPLPELAREAQPTLRFVLSEPVMFGHAGCNRFTARAALRGTTLVAQPVAITQKACADSSVMARESRYAAAMSEGGWFRLDGNELVLSRGGTEVARFWRR